MIYLLHAYSDANLGDRLLVDLSVRRLRGIGVSDAELTIVALDPASFTEHGPVIGWGTARRSLSPETLGAAAMSLGTLVASATGGRFGWGDLVAKLPDPTGFVGVGGGYLRAGSATEQLGVAVNHLPQLIAANRTSAPSVYLPQSVGPLRGPIGRLLRSQLARVDRLWLRDDKSMAEVATDNAEYLPDLAVLDLAEQGVSPVASGTAVALVARRLDRRRPGYLGRLSELAGRLEGEAVWAVQAEGAKEKSDRAFYSSIAVEPAGTTLEVLAQHEPAVVVSVRLHGSMMALAHGHPTIHLGYQRKGWSAMRDLGLGEWVHDAGTFDVATVAEQIDELRRDPSRYWRCVEGATEALSRAGERLDEDLAKLLRVG